MSPKKIKRPVDIYVRVSRVNGREGDSYISPEVQEERCRALATARGLEVGEVIVDEDVSGGKMQRPGLDRALERIEARESGGIIVARIDRFSRSLIGGLKTIEEIDQAGGVVLTAEGDFDTSTATGELVLNIMLTLGQFELRRIRENWSAAQTRAVDRGIHISSTIPAGYNRDPETRLLVPNEYAPAILAAFEARADGASWAETAKVLTDAKVPTSHDLRQGRGQNGSVWTADAASKLCKNRVYLGEARSGSIVNPDAHEAIVSPGLFARVQARKGDPGSYVAPGVTRELLAGLVRCAGCGNVMTPDTTRKDGRVYKFWRCKSGERCPARAGISVPTLESYVLGIIAQKAELTPPERRSNDHATRAAEILLENATAAVEEFSRTWRGTGLSPALAAQMAADLEREREEAAAALNDARSGQAGDPLAELLAVSREQLEEWLGHSVDAGVVRESARTAEVTKGEGLAAALYAINRVDNARARQLMGQIVDRVLVTKGRAPVDERVDVVVP